MIKDSVCHLGYETFRTCSPIKSLPKTHSLNLNYIKIYKPRYAPAFSPRFLSLIITNHFLVILNHFLIIACHVIQLTVIPYHI